MLCYLNMMMRLDSLHGIKKEHIDNIIHLCLISYLDVCGIGCNLRSATLLDYLLYFPQPDTHGFNYGLDCIQSVSVF